jgi:hypothetical protein
MIVCMGTPALRKQPILRVQHSPQDSTQCGRQPDKEELGKHLPAALCWLLPSNCLSVDMNSVGRDYTKHL